MVCLAAPQLLLAVTLPLLGSPGATASQPDQSQAGGESGQPLNQERGAGESVPVAIYVQLDSPDETWLPVLSESLTLPTALPSSSPRTLTGLSLTTVCNVSRQGYISCTCRAGYQWDSSSCSRHRPCSCSDRHLPCSCLVFEHSKPGYCQLLPPVPGNLSLSSGLQPLGSTLKLTLSFSQEISNLTWFLKRPGECWNILQPGAQVSLNFSQDQAVLTVTDMSQEWAGEYMSYFEAQGFLWELHQTVSVPLEASDVAQLLDQPSVTCTGSSGFQLSCCTPKTPLTYTASWSPGEDSQASLLHTPSSQCLVLAVPHCPATDTTYTCELQSQGLAPLRVPVFVTILRDGDVTCPEDSLVVAWNVTKAGHEAQAPCPVGKRGVVKRLCGPDGLWGAIDYSCTDTRLLNLFAKAKLLLAGRGKPAEKVPKILARMSRLVEEASSPSDLVSLLGTIEALAKVVATASVQLNRSALQDLLTTTDKVLDMDISSLWTPAQDKEPSASSDLLLALETLARSLCPPDQPFTFNLTNVQLDSQLYTPSLSPDYRVSLPPVQVQIPQHSLAPHVPNGTNVRITSLLLQKLGQLLPPNYGQELGDALYVTSGQILSISIMAGSQAINQVKVIMNFGDINGSAHCVFWDYRLFQGNGGWSEEGCQVASAQPPPRCICQHLTAFSILMSQCSVPQAPALGLLSQVGLGASIAALLVCLAVYRLVWRVVVRNKVAYFRHASLVNMALCLLAADTCFLGSLLFRPETHSPLCLATAFLSHFLYLATFFWMLAQALVLAHQLLFVFHQLSKHQVLPIMVILGYLCPLGFAGLTLGLYLPRGQYLREGECWLDGKGGALYTFVGPVLVVVGVNGLVLAMAVLKLLRPSLSEGPPAEKRQALLGVAKALLILTPIFGLTWGLGLATLLEEVSIVPHYIFTILNAFQGVFILLFGCLMDKKVREALRKRFCGTQAPSSAISLATNETQVLDHSRGGSEDSR
nr:adhesion G-protein coupled receptor F3 isoform X3 [Oryctolagus cuniculus]